MPFPMPLDASFRKELIKSWIQDVYDRLELNDTESAKLSWNAANAIYLSLPAGQGDFFMERELTELLIKIDGAEQSGKS